MIAPSVSSEFSTSRVRVGQGSRAYRAGQMARQTYDEALARVLDFEGGYSNDVGVPGGPTNWGISIYDARKYWKPKATAAGVRRMPVSVAKDIYLPQALHRPLHYNELPAGLD
jgi:lysozyme family protein